jgi:hypothetical protein
VRICLQVRRLRCANQHCAQRIFAERAEEVVGAHAGRTVRLRDIQRSVGLALGGEAGTRLVERLGMPVSADTMLWIVRADHQILGMPSRFGSMIGRGAEAIVTALC